MQQHSESVQAELDRYLEFAVATAQDAGRVTLRYFRNEAGARFKEDQTPVTIADIEAEELIRARLQRAFPAHDIVGEEGGESLSGSGFRWFVDPIDGTKSFVRGVPLYGVLLGLEIDGTVEVGVAHFPGIQDTVWARSGAGTFLNGRRVRVAPTSELKDATLAYTDMGNFAPHGRQAAFERLAAAVQVRAGWSDAFGHALVASGRIELMLDPVMNAWDCGPFPVLLREAGGFFGSWSGEEGMHHGEAISVNRALLPEVLRLIEGR